jgi:hypothetical protein
MFEWSAVIIVRYHSQDVARKFPPRLDVIKKM